jgi:ribonuclease D
VYISEEGKLAEFCAYASGLRVVSVDTEFLREKTYYPLLCLVQVAVGDRIAAIDPIRIRDLSPLRELFENRDVTKVFHACGQDLEVIFDAMGCVPEPVFDTQVAAAFLGHRMQIGYGALVEAYTGVHLPKAESLTDWSKRPLDPEQLKYAEDDVRYLTGIYSDMMSELVKADRLSWVQPEMAARTARENFVRDPRETYLHLKRASTLTRRQLAIAREVCAWREETAARRDIPRKWVLSDEVIVEVCKRAPRTIQSLKKIRGGDSVGTRDAGLLLEAVRRGVECEPERCPEMRRRQRPSGETEGIVDLLYALLRLKAERAGVAAQLVATRDDLLEFAQGRPTQVTEGWRYQIAGKDLEGLLSGSVGLTVKDGRIEVL